MSGVKNNPCFSRTPDSALTFVHELSRYSVPSECWKHHQEADFRIIAYERPMTKQYASHQLSIEKAAIRSVAGARMIASSMFVMYFSQNSSVANSKRGAAMACMLRGSYAAMPKTAWMNWRCATASPLGTQRT